MADPSSIFGIPVWYSTIVPKDEFWLIDARNLNLPTIYHRPLVSAPTMAKMIFNECRRLIGRECPMISPEGWSDLPSLWPPMDWRIYRDTILGMPPPIGLRVTYLDLAEYGLLEWEALTPPPSSHPPEP